MEDMEYKTYEVQLDPGDTFFVYTDGLPEATNADLEMFGSDRLLAAMNAESDATPEQLINNIHAAVDEFVKNAEQFDDLTMLCLEYRGNHE